MEGGRGIAVAVATIVCGAILFFVVLSLIFLIAYYVRPKDWKVITASLLNLLGILLYLVFELHEETYVNHQRIILYLLLIVFLLNLFVGLFRNHKR